MGLDGDGVEYNMALATTSATRSNVFQSRSRLLCLEATGARRHVGDSKGRKVLRRRLLLRRSILPRLSINSAFFEIYKFYSEKFTTCVWLFCKVHYFLVIYTKLFFKLSSPFLVTKLFGAVKFVTCPHYVACPFLFFRLS